MSLAEELRGSNVRVHVICPGGVDTELVSRVRPDIKKEDLIGPGELMLFNYVIQIILHCCTGHYPVLGFTEHGLAVYIKQIFLVLDKETLPDELLQVFLSFVVNLVGIQADIPWQVHLGHDRA